MTAGPELEGVGFTPTPRVVMKQIIAAVIVLGGLAACEKPNDLARLQEQATITAKYYQPKLDDLNHRIQTISTRGKALPTGIAGVTDASRLLSDAGRRFMAAREIAAAGPNGQSKLEKEGDELAKVGDSAALAKRLDEDNEELEENTRVAGDELKSVEGWLATAETQPKPTTEPPTPEPTATPAQ
jgi:hypothetical protein